jgi:hypothetical protein
VSKNYFDIFKQYWDKSHVTNLDTVAKERERVLDALQEILDIFWYKPSCTPANIMSLMYSDLHMSDEEVESRNAKRNGKTND